MHIFSQPSIYTDGWLYAMSMTSVVCNVPVLSQNDSTYHHSVFTTWKWHPFDLDAKFHHPSLGASPPNRGKTVFACLQNSRKMENHNSVNNSGIGILCSKNSNERLAFPAVARLLVQYRHKYYTVTLKSRSRVTQGHWKRNHWIDHTRLSSSRVI